MRDGSLYRGNRKRDFPTSKFLKWERKKRGITRQALDRERGEVINPIQSAHTKEKNR